MNVYNNKCSPSMFDSLFFSAFFPNKLTNCSDQIKDNCFHCMLYNLYTLKIWITNYFFLNHILFLYSDTYQEVGLVSGFSFLMCFVKNETSLT